jgi:hypothetical protein
MELSAPLAAEAACSEISAATEALTHKRLAHVDLVHQEIETALLPAGFIFKFVFVSTWGDPYAIRRLGSAGVGLLCQSALDSVRAQLGSVTPLNRRSSCNSDSLDSIKLMWLGDDFGNAVWGGRHYIGLNGLALIDAHGELLYPVAPLSAALASLLCVWVCRSNRISPSRTTRRVSAASLVDPSSPRDTGELVEIGEAHASARPASVSQLEGMAGCAPALDSCARHRCGDGSELHAMVTRRARHSHDWCKLGSGALVCLVLTARPTQRCSHYWPKQTNKRGSIRFRFRVVRAAACQTTGGPSISCSTV